MLDTWCAVRHAAPMLSPRRALTLLLLTALATTASANIPPPTAPAEPTEGPSTREQLELAVAQVCVNEAGFWRFEDCDLIWQTTARFASDEARLRWLRTHSCRVLGQEYCRRPRPCEAGRNCVWAQHLTWSDTPPVNWPADVVFPTGRWRRLRAHVRELVRGTGRETPSAPCAGQPVTWGGTMDAAQALANGYVALECGRTRNTGYGRATR